jgi:hypothetical protein
MFVATAVAEKISAMETEDYLYKRAKHGSREKFEIAMAQIPDVSPDLRDAK